MNIKQIAKDTAKMLQNYLTYQAVKTVLAQLSETNPPLALWLQYFSADKLQDGEPYIEELFREKPDLALRIMIVREHLAQEVAEYLPEMVRTGIMQANMEHRRQHLERSTQLETFDPLSTSQEQATSDPNSEDVL
ncbi:MAG: chaperonin family protein RbcX [Rhizonema sp. NSF051]|uniref:RuBisCO chaperone RbcX n=50 Tax=Rhizonema TaxID=1441869 RepID=A0A3G2SGU0_9CYAN|nr:chaperonin-like protein [Rhizonema sp. 'cyanobiont of Cora sp. NSF012_214376190']AYO46952.1 chaperonin-like protein [Rhizonema sp. 'cyanobiont of Cora sp. NSF013_214376187']AYO46954.1 chaperonin-like protein [Rhizonema sp. 'cyanobiont of Cora sp. NSF014_214376166']AYO46956.1 chaperonin-like protein [Rhizonema sp. 'cyanobiont of Cora sp. NSF015_214376163']AYO46958.1 chaperonin-like protein [Rhizonema sp. 'cyanobiont of Cora sp. NSF018_214376215']AYO46960.1 chaperonin-like protein [Rhizonema 